MLGLGDRVARDPLFGWTGVVRYGTVVDVYHGAPACNGPGVLLFAVKWDDDGQIIRGYLEVGLRKLPEERKEETKKAFDVHDPPVRLRRRDR